MWKGCGRRRDFFWGEHDFKSFCGNTRMKKSTVRTLYEIRVEEHESEIDLFFTGNGFLQNMVRILTGTLIEVGDGRREPGSMTDVLARRDRQAAGYTGTGAGAGASLRGIRRRRAEYDGTGISEDGKVV